MDANPKIGTPLQEAMHGFARQIAAIYRVTLDDRFSLDAHLIQDGTFIAVSAVFPDTDSEAWVPLDLGVEGWNESRRARLVHEFGHVARECLALEKFTTGYVSAKLGRIIDGYR